jgi:hypothetical protein
VGELTHRTLAREAPSYIERRLLYERQGGDIPLGTACPQEEREGAERYGLQVGSSAPLPSASERGDRRNRGVRPGLVCLYVFAVSAFIPSQTLGSITFERCWSFYGGNNFTYIGQQTRDGGYIVGASVRYPGLTPRPINVTNGLVKVDSLGQIEWFRWYDSPDSTAGGGPFVCELLDGGFAVGGTRGGDDPADVYLVKTDSVGDTCWTYTCGGPGLDLVYSTTPTSDSGIAVSGCLSDGSGSSCSLLKLTKDGNLAWARTYKRDGYKTGEGVALETADRGFVVYSSLISDTMPDGGSVYLIKTDSVGDTVWTATCKPEWGVLTALWNVSIGPGGEYTVLAWAERRDVDSVGTFLARFDTLGHVAWDTVILRNSQYGVYHFMRCVQVLPDGGYILTGDQITHAVKTPVVLLRLGAQCESLWSRLFDGLDPGHGDVGRWVTPTRDGGYAVIANAELRYVYLIKTDSLGQVEVGTAEPTQAEPGWSSVEVLPSTFRDMTCIRYSLRSAGHVRVNVADAAGRVVARLRDDDVAAGTGEVVWQPRDLPAGVYLVRVETPDGNAVRRAVLLR